MCTAPGMQDCRHEDVHYAQWHHSRNLSAARPPSGLLSVISSLELPDLGALLDTLRNIMVYITPVNL